MTATTKNVTRTAALCFGLLAASVVWSDDCQQGAKAQNATKPNVAQAPSLSASGLYKIFHDPRLNKPDGLGDYIHNFQADRPL